MKPCARRGRLQSSSAEQLAQPSSPYTPELAQPTEALSSSHGASSLPLPCSPVLLAELPYVLSSLLRLSFPQAPPAAQSSCFFLLLAFFLCHAPCPSPSSSCRMRSCSFCPAAPDLARP
ncbi:hypothetical protein Zm00014a_027210 [Zea mays]|uniref:Uncharacterized protein n=1 Tax=Zea mays TaxID=4577 RepID=A0A3L6DDF0_MAIZE|nr:hypothetical protein Zm00014a_027210 [Zea mays]